MFNFHITHCIIYDTLFENIYLIINRLFQIIAAYLNNTQDNILALDYRDITYQAYIISTIAINILGELMANALNSIVDRGVNPEKIHIIGHSLGAHLAAKISRKTKFKISRITGVIHFLKKLFNEI